MQLFSALMILLATLCLQVEPCSAFVAVPHSSRHVPVQRLEGRRGGVVVSPQVNPNLPLPSPASAVLRTYSNSNRHTRRQSSSSVSLSLSLWDSIPAPLIQYCTTAFASSGPVPLGHAFVVNALGFLLLQKKLLGMLTLGGFANAFALGTLLWATLGWKGWTICVSFLIGGVLVTKVKFAEKEQQGIAESRGGRRGPENLWGSAATGLVCALCSSYGPSFLGISSDLYVLAYVASIATKLADTFASEIGKAYGKTTFLITTFERVQPGTEGAVSAEGTAAALLGGFLLSALGYSLGLISSVTGLAISTMAAFLATNVESLLGATLQEKKGFEWMTNEVINFLNTMIGAAIAVVGGKLFLV